MIIKIMGKLISMYIFFIRIGPQINSLLNNKNSRNIIIIVYIYIYN